MPTLKMDKRKKCARVSTLMRPNLIIPSRRTTLIRLLQSATMVKTIMKSERSQFPRKRSNGRRVTTVVSRTPSNPVPSMAASERSETFGAQTRIDDDECKLHRNNVEMED